MGKGDRDLGVGGGGVERRGKKTDRQTETQRQRERDGQRDRETDGRTDREVD